MPQLFVFGPYVIFFWSDDNGEPVHVHVAIKKPTTNATKIWLTADGGCIRANNNGRIPEKDLRTVEKLVRFNHGEICNRWVELFGEGSLRFYE